MKFVRLHPNDRAVSELVPGPANLKVWHCCWKGGFSTYALDEPDPSEELLLAQRVRDAVIYDVDEGD